MKTLCLLVISLMCVFAASCEKGDLIDLQDRHSDNSPDNASHEPPDNPPSGTHDVHEWPPVHKFSRSNVIVTPDIISPSFDEAVLNGNVSEQKGVVLPGAAFGTWYTIAIDGIEYYYGIYDHDKDTAHLFNYAIMDDRYSLACGLAVGMGEDDICEKYPDVAIMNISAERDGLPSWHDYTYESRHRNINLGWNRFSYPKGWSNQFDYVILADIDTEADDGLPLYLGLLIKDNIVEAITFYHPTAG